MVLHHLQHGLPLLLWLSPVDEGCDEWNSSFSYIIADTDVSNKLAEQAVAEVVPSSRLV